MSKVILLFWLGFNAMLGSAFLLGLTTNPELAFKGFLIGMGSFWALTYLQRDILNSGGSEDE